MRNLPWYKRHVGDWRGGTRGMTMELRGFYSECLDAMWDRQSGLPNDVQKLSVMLDCNPRTVRKLLPQLVRLGKLVLTENGYLNERMAGDIGVKCDPFEGELEPKSSPIQRQSEPNSKPNRIEFEPKNENSSMFSTRDLEAKKLREERPPTPKGVLVDPPNELKIEKPFPSNVRPMETYGSNPPGWETVNGRLNPVGDERTKLLSHFGGDEIAFGIALEKVLEKMKQSPRRYQAGRARQLLLTEAESNYRSKRYAETRAKPAANAPKTVSEVLKERMAAANGATIQ